MNPRLLLAAFGGLFTAGYSHAQTASWCPPGAVWQYGYATMSPIGGAATATISYSGDALFRGYSVQVMSRVANGSQGQQGLPSVLMRLSNDSVFFVHDSTFVLLYRFNAQPGDTWQTYSAYADGVCPELPVRFTVDSVGVQTVAGRPLRWQKVSVTHRNGTHSWGRIYEGIGGLIAPQPRAFVCGGTDPDVIVGLRSFGATGWPTVVPAANGMSFRPLATAEARATQGGFVAYPNPTAGLLSLQSAAPLAAAQVTLRDLTGRQLRQQPLPASRQLDLRDLPAGTYLLTLESPGQPALTRRITVQ